LFTEPADDILRFNVAEHGGELRRAKYLRRSHRKKGQQ